MPSTQCVHRYRSCREIRRGDVIAPVCGLLEATLDFLRDYADELIVTSFVGTRLSLAIFRSANRRGFGRQQARCDAVYIPVGPMGVPIVGTVKMGQEGKE